jgi:hypothetical protein
MQGDGCPRHAVYREGTDNDELRPFKLRHTHFQSQALVMNRGSFVE